MILTSIGLVLFVLFVLIISSFNIKKAIVVLISASTVIIISGFLLLKYFLGAFANPKIEITKDYISTDQDFENGVTIEDVKVDSFGIEG